LQQSRAANYHVVVFGVVGVGLVAGVVFLSSFLSQPVTPIPMAQTRPTQSNTARNFFTGYHPFNENGVHRKNHTLSRRFAAAMIITW
jgi:hypothetical protein